MQGHPSDGPLLWTGPGPPLLTFRIMHVGKDLSDHVSHLCHFPLSKTSQHLVTHVKASIIPGTCSPGWEE